MKKQWSVLVNDLNTCVECGCRMEHKHHIFFGISSEKKRAEKMGYMIPLCYMHHESSQEGIHHNPELNLKWRQIAQEHYEQTHTRSQFIQDFGRNYL